jgi:hypothetical protein
VIESNQIKIETIFFHVSFIQPIIILVSFKPHNVREYHQTKTKRYYYHTLVAAVDHTRGLPISLLVIVVGSSILEVG